MQRRCRRLALPRPRSLSGFRFRYSWLCVSATEQGIVDGGELALINWCNHCGTIRKAEPSACGTTPKERGTIVGAPKRGQPGAVATQSAWRKDGDLTSGRPGKSCKEHHCQRWIENACRAAMGAVRVIESSGDQDNASCTFNSTVASRKVMTSDAERAIPREFAA